ncbi:13196_t:CDS:2, partial [Funneliformis geosporum]
PDNRPSMNQVVDKLNALVSKTNITEDYQMNNYKSNNFEAISNSFLIIGNMNIKPYDGISSKVSK